MEERREKGWKGERRTGGRGRDDGPRSAGCMTLPRGPLPSVGPSRQTGCAEDYPVDTVRDDYRNLGSRSI